MATSPDPQKNVPSQEKLLLDYVQRLEKHKRERQVVHVHLSELRPFNRREQHLRAASSGFESLIADRSGQLFQLRSSDLFFAFKKEVRPHVETVVQKIRFLFSDDPLIEEEGANGKELASWYDGETEYDAILGLVQDTADAEEKRQTRVRSRMDAKSALKAKQQQGEPLTPEVLDRVQDALSRADLSNYVRRQFICNVDSKLVPEQRFSELFISISDLRETLMPGVNLASNRWLFHYLTETLDMRMLSLLSKTDAITITGEISINVNVKTLLSDEFQYFDDNISASRRGSMVIELQKEDIFSDLSAYLFAREFVQERGYRVCLDGISAQTLFIIDRERLGADLIKVIWNQDMINPSEEVQARLREMTSSGKERVIISRCDSRSAVDFGRSVGVELYQGRYVESLIAEDGRRRDLLKLKHRIQRSADREDDEELEDDEII